MLSFHDEACTRPVQRDNQHNNCHKTSIVNTIATVLRNMKPVNVLLSVLLVCQVSVAMADVPTLRRDNLLLDFPEGDIIGQLVIPHPRLMRGFTSVANPHALPREDTITIAILVASILFTIAFQRIHKNCHRTVAMILAIGAENLTRGIKPVEQDVGETFAILKRFIRELETATVTNLKDILGTVFPQDKVDSVALYMTAYFNNDINTVVSFPEGQNVAGYGALHNPWNPHADQVEYDIPEEEEEEEEEHHFQPEAVDTDDETDSDSDDEPENDSDNDN